MSEAKKRILEMLAQNKISADEAYRLINVLDGDNAGRDNAGHDNRGHNEPVMEAPRPKASGKYLRVTIVPNPNAEDQHADRVNVKVPMALVRAGIKMKSLIPPEAKVKINDAFHEKGINFDIDSIKNEDIEELLAALGDMQIDIEGQHGEKVKVYVE